MPLGQRSQHMVICGDDALAHRLAVELDAVCGEAVTVVLPSRRDQHGADIAALHRDPHSPIELIVAPGPDERTLRAAGVERAAALALTYADDQVNMTAALLARGLNPSIRLLQVDGKVFRGVVRAAGTSPHTADLATLAVLSGAHEDDPASEDSAETAGSAVRNCCPTPGPRTGDSSPTAASCSKRSPTTTRRASRTTGTAAAPGCGRDSRISPGRCSSRARSSPCSAYSPRSSSSSP
ncbi:NAD-binding protein [Streptomyces sp. NPDC059534]|uniref:NAD-binding protein n=1 Tax=Streptomyces sp. NPDC059534 TaxID=3346859 RepID=UPI0036B21643